MQTDLFLDFGGQTPTPSPKKGKRNRVQNNEKEQSNENGLKDTDTDKNKPNEAPHTTPEKAKEIENLKADYIVNTTTNKLADAFKKLEDEGTPVNVAMDCLSGEMLGESKEIKENILLDHSLIKRETTK